MLRLLIFLQAVAPTGPIAQAPAPANMPTWAWVLVTILGLALPTVGIYIGSVMAKRAEGRNQNELATINSKEELKDIQLKNLHDALTKAVKDFKELEEAFAIEQKVRVEAEQTNIQLSHRLTVLKVSFKMVLTAYTNYFKDDPEQLILLKEFETVLREEEEEDTNETNETNEGTT